MYDLPMTVSDGGATNVGGSSFVDRNATGLSEHPTCVQALTWKRYVV